MIYSALCGGAGPGKLFLVFRPLNVKYRKCGIEISSQISIGDTFIDIFLKSIRDITTNIENVAAIINRRYWIHRY